MEHAGHSEPHGGLDPPGEARKAEPDEHRIRERAHEIWIEEGRPEGRARTTGCARAGIGTGASA